MLMIKIIITLLTLVSTLPAKYIHAESLTITEPIINKVEPYIKELREQLENIFADFHELQQKASKIAFQASSSTVDIQNTLKTLQTKLQEAKDFVFEAKKTASLATKTIPYFSAEEELTALKKELILLKKQKPSPTINAQIITKKTAIATLEEKIIRKQKILNQDKQEYIVISNPLNTRINIYAALKNNPINISKRLVTSIPSSIKKFKIECHPDYIYIIKAKNKNCVMINNKKIYTYKTLKRNNKKQNQLNGFSDTDHGRLLIINNNFSFNIHTLQSGGPKFVASIPHLPMIAINSTNDTYHAPISATTTSKKQTKIQKMYEYLSTEVASIAEQIGSYAQQLKDAIMEASKAESHFKTLSDLIKNKACISKTNYEYISLSNNLEGILEDLNIIYSNIDFTINDIKSAAYNN